MRRLSSTGRRLDDLDAWRHRISFTRAACPLTHDRSVFATSPVESGCMQEGDVRAKRPAAGHGGPAPSRAWLPFPPRRATRGRRGPTSAPMARRRRDAAGAGGWAARRLRAAFPPDHCTPNFTRVSRGVATDNVSSWCVRQMELFSGRLSLESACCRHKFLDPTLDMTIRVRLALRVQFPVRTKSTSHA